MRYGIYYQFIGKREGQVSIFATSGDRFGRSWGDSRRFAMSCDELALIQSNNRWVWGRDKTYYDILEVSGDKFWGLWLSFGELEMKVGDVGESGEALWLLKRELKWHFWWFWDHFAMIEAEFGAREWRMRHSMMSLNKLKAIFRWVGDILRWLTSNWLDFGTVLKFGGILRCFRTK